MTPLKEYYDRLSRHDWTYGYSDDPGVWREGHDERLALQSISKESEAHASLYNAFFDRVYSNGPQPERPE